MGAIFAKPELVVEPGLPQLTAFGLVLSGTVGLAFSLQATFSAGRARDLGARVVLAGLSLVAVLHPDPLPAALAVVPIAAFGA